MSCTMPKPPLLSKIRFSVIIEQEDASSYHHVSRSHQCKVMHISNHNCLSHVSCLLEQNTQTRHNKSQIQVLFLVIKVCAL